MATITTDETTLLFFYIAAVLLTHGFVREVHRAIVRAARAASVGEDERIDSQDVRSLQAQNVREEPVHVSCRDQSVEYLLEGIEEGTLSCCQGDRRESE